MDQGNFSQPPRETSRDERQVSVVVPSYNHAPFVESTLRSIFRQTLAPSQLLVIDDGSTDNSPYIIERVLRDCPFECELISRTNRGLCATLNEALIRTSGRYFAYLGSDDLWLPAFLATRVSSLERRASAVLGYGHAFLINEKNDILDCTLDWAHYADGDARGMLLGNIISPMSPTVLYRRTVLERHGWNERARLEDYELYLRLSAEGEFAFDSNILAAWRQHSTNASRDYLWMIQEQLKAQSAVSEELKLNADELDYFRRVLQFAGGENLLRLGDKKQSLSYLRQGWRTGSAVARARVILRLLAPYSLIKWLKRRRKARSARQYGQLPL